MEALEEFLNSGIGNIIKVVGILATFVISAFALYVNIRISKKGAYIKEITPLRERYIQNLRQHVAEFASLALELNRATLIGEKADPVLKKQLLRDLDLKHGQTLLFLNNENPIDKQLGNYLMAIRLAAVSRGNDGMQIEDTIRRMFLYTQQVLLFEWQNLKYEATNGPMNRKQIDQKRQEFLNVTIHGNPGL